ncbi:hypothetical protein O6H91_02G138700 [Diphasiastrum complanatum]|uniref:Uncharacterized protein n=2 Tax=Diphasiastrum complanatum TaxID=34168 RepID=A0ACC2ELB2_DIPCM|nr:hypothetical protein O6H91_02G138700 [Diphasiastrum complanatum]
MAWEAYNALMDDPRLLVLDTRNPRVFAAGHIRGSVCVAVSARPGTNTLERLEGCGPPTWSANCWWDRNVLLVPSSGSSSSSSHRDSIKTSRKRKAAESVLGEDNITSSHPVVHFLVKEKLTRSLKILKHDGEGEDPFSAFCARYPFLITKSCKPATISGYPSEIVPDLLYLGDRDHAMAENRLNDLHISHVLTIHTEPIVLKKHFVQMFCDLADEPNANIGKYFESMFEFVEAARKSGGRVLVHCGAGASRSATLCAYYVMRVKRWSLKETLKFMRAQRKQVEPNSGFLAVLSEFQDLLGIKSSKVNTLPSSSVWSLSDHRNGKATKVAASVERTQPYLKIFKDEQCIDVINLMDRRKLIFGRLGVCDVILGHPSISRQHARLELREASEFVLIDLNSVHGTFVNGKPLRKNGQCVLNVGDVVQFGASTKKYVLTFGQFEAPTNMT